MVSVREFDSNGCQQKDLQINVQMMVAIDLLFWRLCAPALILRSRSQSNNG